MFTIYYHSLVALVTIQSILRIYGYMRMYFFLWLLVVFGYGVSCAIYGKKGKAMQCGT